MEYNAKRDNADKLTYAGLPWVGIEELARVSHFGMLKYGQHNWRKGLKEEEILNSAMRHLMSYVLSEKRTDHESGIHTLVHAAWNLLVIAEQDILNNTKGIHFYSEQIRHITE